MYKIGSHTQLKNEEESQRISFALQLKPPSQNYYDILRSYSVESVSSVSYIYVRTYILTSTYICLSLSFTFYATKKNENENAKNHKKKKNKNASTIDYKHLTIYTTSY